MKIYSVLLAAIAVAVVACSPTKDADATKALDCYTQFVDSIYVANTFWQSAVDTDFVEIPTDPTDPTKTKIDTIVTLPENKEASILLNPLFGKMIQHEYEPIKAEVDAKLDKMDDQMKKAYQESKAKYESLLYP
jgi:hypothetical protein